nr:ribonuclease E [Cryptomonas sp. NIES-3952]
MSYKLIILEKSGLGLIYFHNKLLNIVMEHNLYKVNDIYLGKISTILPSLDAAFIVLNPISKNGFISFEHSRDKSQFYDKSNLIKSQKTIIVQITREPIGTKGPSVTSEVSLIGKYLALLPFSQFILIKKNPSIEVDKEYVKAIGNLLINPKDMGILLKPKIIQANVNFLIREIRILKCRWNLIVARSLKISKPSLLSKRKSFLNKILEDYSDINFEFIAVDSYETAKKIKAILSKIKQFHRKKNTFVQFHNKENELIRHYLIDIILSEIMKPRVNLPKGGYIIIEKTEALTTIDINSGSFTTLHNSRQTSLWVNYLAAYEIIKQIRLRNIGGIIIIDFIDSSNQLDQMKLLQYMHTLIKKDYVKCTIIQMSELGLLEMTRARYGQSVYDAFTRRCNVCSGLGYLSININKTQTNYYELILTNVPTISKKLCNRIQILYN